MLLQDRHLQGLPRCLYQSFQEDDQNDLQVKHLVKHPNPLYSLCFIKYSHGMPTWIKDRDVKLIAKENNKRNAKKLEFIQHILI